MYIYNKLSFSISQNSTKVLFQIYPSVVGFYILVIGGEKWNQPTQIHYIELCKICHINLYFKKIKNYHWLDSI